MRRHLFKPRVEPLMGIALMICQALSPVDAAASPPVMARDLHLDVRVGGRAIGLIGAFHQRADGVVMARRQELEALGIRTPAHYGEREQVPLSAIPGLAYAYDEASQSIDIAVPEAGLLPKAYDARPAGAPATLARPSDAGAVLNYTLYGGSDGGRLGELWRYPAVSAALDARLFGPWGVVSQTGVVSGRAPGRGEAEALRLETAWSYSDPTTAMSYRAGDIISGGLAWTRPIRMGGAQVQRNFDLRPDLITLALPSVAGSAAVPSTVDVFVNGVRTISQDVASGPFRIDNVPILSGNGNADIVLRDASGRQSRTTLPFIVSSKLLRPGLLDFSAEIGTPRLQYGLRSSLYGDAIAGSGSARYGLADRVTLLAHGEAAPSFGAGGFGAILGLGSFGLLSLAASGSSRDGAVGGQGYGAFETRMGGLSVLASMQRSFGDYRDLASLAAPWSRHGKDALAAPTASAIDSEAWMRLLLPPRALDRLSIGFPVFGSGLNLGFAHVRTAAGARNRIVNAGLTRALPRGGAIYATVFADLDRKNSAGIFAGLSFPLGADVTASVGVSRSGSDWALASDLARHLSEAPGSVGWRLRDVEGTTRRRSAVLAWRGGAGAVEIGAAKADERFSGAVQFDGAIVAAGGGIFLANRIDDAFAVAKVGAPDVDVLFENRVVARTDSRGHALIPTLRAYQPNRIAIDPRGLPVTALAETTQDVLAPPDRAGVVVDFGVRSVATSAIVVLVGRDGKPLAPGSRGALQLGLRGAGGQAPDFVVGYDGRAFIENLAAGNTIRVRLAEGDCVADFPFAPSAVAQVAIGPVTCR